MFLISSYHYVTFLTLITLCVIMQASDTEDKCRWELLVVPADSVIFC